MKKIYVLLLSAFSFIMLSGCNDWIELEPKDTVATSLSHLQPEALTDTLGCAESSTPFPKSLIVP